VDPGAEPGMVPIGEDVLVPVGGEVRPQPTALRRGRAAAAEFRGVRVEHEDVPRPGVVAVVAPGRIASSGTEVAVVALGSGRLVVVVAGRGPRPRLVPAPGRTVAIAELGSRPGRIGVVAEGDDRAGDAVEQLGCRAVGD